MPEYGTLTIRFRVNFRLDGENKEKEIILVRKHDVTREQAQKYAREFTATNTAPDICCEWQAHSVAVY